MAEDETTAPAASDSTPSVSTSVEEVAASTSPSTTESTAQSTPAPEPAVEKPVEKPAEAVKPAKPVAAKRASKLRDLETKTFAAVHEEAGDLQQDLEHLAGLLPKQFRGDRAQNIPKQSL